MRSDIASLVLGVTGLALAQTGQDPGTYGPPIELVHRYYDQWPTGIAVSASGRKFSNYPPGLDSSNTKYTVAELGANNTEVPFPSVQINSPPGGQINYTTYPPTGANYQDYLVGVQSVVIDPADRLWILDTGRPSTPDGYNVYSSYGGPKLVGVDLTNDTIFQTIIFPPNVSFPDSYLNDIRFDLNPNLSDTSGSGVAYITDSSSEGRNGIIIVDLGTGASWRHLTGAPQTRPEPGFWAQVWGEPVISNAPSQPLSPIQFGSDGIALSADGSTLYFSAVSSRTLYSIPTSRLRSRSPTSELLALQSIAPLTQKGVTDGMETDTNNYIYMGSVETNSINLFFPENGTVGTFIRDPRIEWTDTLSVATDGYVYFTENQLWRRPGQQGGVDKRVKPYGLWRAKLPGAGTKVTASG